MQMTVKTSGYEVGSMVAVEFDSTWTVGMLVKGHRSYGVANGAGNTVVSWSSGSKVRIRLVGSDFPQEMAEYRAMSDALTGEYVCEGVSTTAEVKEAQTRQACSAAGCKTGDAPVMLLKIATGPSAKYTNDVYFCGTCWKWYEHSTELGNVVESVSLDTAEDTRHAAWVAGMAGDPNVEIVGGHPYGRESGLPVFRNVAEEAATCRCEEIFAEGPRFTERRCPCGAVFPAVSEVHTRIGDVWYDIPSARYFRVTRQHMPTGDVIMREFGFDHTLKLSGMDFSVRVRDGVMVSDANSPFLVTPAPRKLRKHKSTKVARARRGGA